MPAYPYIFIDTDTQYDFMKSDGRLYVPQAETIIPNLAALIERAGRDGICVLSSVDAHPPDDPEFARFPPHCVLGTPGQQKLSETLLEPRRVITAEQTLGALEPLLEQNRQLIFEKSTFDVFSNPNAARLIETIDVGEYVVFGVATDYCVKAAAIGLRERGQRVAVVEDAVRAVSPETGRQALDEMRRRGVRFCRTADWVG